MGQSGDKTSRPYGTGPTETLSLRVSVATLNRVWFDHPEDGRTMLALERTAAVTTVQGRPGVVVKTKPFGGGVRLVRPAALQAAVGDFHFDSRRSLAEMDLRIFIRPGQWPALKEFCLAELQAERGALENRPDRELAEEFADSLGIELKQGQYRLQPDGLAVEEQPEPASSLRALGRPTVRIYRLFDVQLADVELARRVLADSRGRSDAELKGQAQADTRTGGRGRANGVLAVSLADLQARYEALPYERRGGPIYFAGHYVESNVLALLAEVRSPKYTKLG